MPRTLRVVTITLGISTYIKNRMCPCSLSDRLQWNSNSILTIVCTKASPGCEVLIPVTVPVDNSRCKRSSAISQLQLNSLAQPNAPHEVFTADEAPCSDGEVKEVAMSSQPRVLMISGDEAESRALREILNGHVMLDS